MNVYDAERVRIAAKHDAGDMSDKEFRQVSRAITRAERFDAEADARHKRDMARQERAYRKAKQARQHLRTQLIQSREVWQ